MKFKDWAVVTAIATFASWTSVILDCDETFNYWEPLHYLLYGDGLKPWEYSEKYALRPYAFLYLLYIPAKLLTFSGLSKWSVFTLCKWLISLLNIYSLYSLCNTFDVSTGLIMTPGILAASTAFLPNSVSTTMAAWSLIYWRQNHTNKLLFTLAAMTIITWPYAVVFYLPFIFSRFDGKQARLSFQFRRYFLAALFSAIYILAPAIIIDYLHHGKVTLTFMNAVLYNVFGGNDEKFGTEGPFYYIRNGLVNYNLLLLLPFASISSIFGSSFFASFALLSSRAHKEERFLYPLIPLMLVASKRWSKSKFLHTVMFIFCIWRFLTIKNYYGGVEKLFSNFKFQPEDVVCVKDQWYRFPSHFAFNNGETRVGFLDSMQFDGALPQYYSNSLFSTFNDQNKRVPSQFTNQCTLFYGTKEEFPETKPLVCKYMLDPSTQAPCRWLFIPHCPNEYVEHCIFESTPLAD